MNDDFPYAWETVLRHRVKLYTVLTEKERNWFHVNIQKFLRQVSIIGDEVHVDDVTKVLVACSAIIPRLAAKSPWHYPNLLHVEIVKFPWGEDFNAFGHVKQTSDGFTVKLVQRTLINGFEWPPHSANVGIHEFIHLTDSITGTIDGFHPLMSASEREEWKKLSFWESIAINFGSSMIDAYAATNDVEFFAVSSEQYFVKPIELKAHHPKVYEFLDKMYGMQMAERFERL
jgi:Mlc titration factor MtfA (ptsG expression regulator)